MMINVPNHGPLPPMDENYEHFLDRTTILYGPSDTGKSFSTKHILTFIKPFIPSVIVIAPTGESTEDYKGVVPDACVFTEIDVEKIKNIWLRQEAATKVYKRVNNYESISNLFNKINHAPSIEQARRMQNLFSQHCITINTSSHSDTMKAEKIIELQQVLKKRLVKIYKDTIRAHGHTLKNPTEPEKEIIKFLDMNPRLLIIFDDCQAQIAEWCNDPTISKLFMQGRHNFVTTFIALQSPNGRPQLSPAIRQQTFNILFTTQEVMTLYFNNAQHGFGLDMKRAAARVAAEVFKPNPDGVTKNHKKVMYQRNHPKSKLSYLLARSHPNFRFGSDALWAMCNKIPIDPSKNSNKFTERFRAV